MFKIHYGFCNFCNKEDQLIVVRAGRCQKCNHEHKQAKKKAQGKKTTGYRYVKESTGEKSVFEIVLERLGDEPARCFVCKERITLITHHCFAHILPKGLYPKFRLNPDNIRILCYNIQGTGCHSLYDHSPHSGLKGEGWERLFELRDRLKQEYRKL